LARMECTAATCPALAAPQMERKIQALYLICACIAHIVHTAIHALFPFSHPAAAAVLAAHQFWLVAVMPTLLVAVLQVGGLCLQAAGLCRPGFHLRSRSGAVLCIVCCAALPAAALLYLHHCTWLHASATLLLYRSGATAAMLAALPLLLFAYLLRMVHAPATAHAVQVRSYRRWRTEQRQLTRQWRRQQAQVGLACICWAAACSRAFTGGGQLSAASRLKVHRAAAVSA